MRGSTTKWLNFLLCLIFYSLSNLYLEISVPNDILLILQNPHRRQGQLRNNVFHRTDPATGVPFQVHDC